MKVKKSLPRYGQNPTINRFMGWLVLLDISLFVYGSFTTISSEIRSILDVCELSIAAIFFIEFILYMYQSPNKKLFLKKYWWVLLAAIPTYSGWGLLRILRLQPLIRALRIGDHYVFNRKIDN